MGKLKYDFGWAFLLGFLYITTTPHNTFAAALDGQVLAELNFARTHPQAYAQTLLRQPISDWERQLDPEDRDADPEAFAEAIDFLMRQTPLEPLRPDDRLAAAAYDHVAEQGPHGDVGHEGPNGEPFDVRLHRHGLDGAWAAEDISYGPPTAAETVRSLIIDQGVPDRGHRRNIFTPQLKAVGITCGAHKTYEVMCVIDFAD